MRRTYLVRRSRAAGWARLCGGLAVPMIVLAALGAHSGFVPMSALIPVLLAGFVLALLALGVAVAALIDVWNTGIEGARSAVAGVIYALPALALLGLIAGATLYYPRLTEVTTSAEDVPGFIDPGAPTRPPDRESLARQIEAFPDIVTHRYPLPLGEVYAAARSLIDSRGWTIIRDQRPTVMPELRTEPSGTSLLGATEDIIRALSIKSVMTQSRGVAATEPAAAAGSIGMMLERGLGNVALLEATARTPVFGFRDIVVVRLTGTPEGTEVDMRSASEMGAHDLGQNARRIRAFFNKLDSELQLDAEPAPPPPGVASAVE